jgi:hypothetical protein
LGGGPPGFARSSTSSALLWRAHVNGARPMSPTGLSPSVVRLSRRFSYRWVCNPSVLPQPRGRTPVWAHIRVRSPLLTESMSLSSPAGNEMFQFPAFALLTLCVQVRVTTGHVAEFPHSEILGSTPVCRLPQAYRRLPRPSSPLDAKTSTLHP